MVPGIIVALLILVILIALALIRAKRFDQTPELFDAKLQKALMSYQPQNPNSRDCWMMIGQINWEHDFIKVLELLRAYQPQDGIVDVQFHEEGFIELENETATVQFLSDSAQCQVSDLLSELELFWAQYKA